MTRWRANAKLTLSLRVLGVRSDGYHELDAIVVSISEPHDEIDIDLDPDGRGVALTIDGPASEGVADDDDNLASRAARLLDASVGITLHKGIPAGAGLGGGSADAAAVLVALNDELGLRKSTEELAALGATLGSDVPVCIHGGSARMRGRGEIIERTELPELHVVIAVPAFTMSTPSVYRAWDELGGPHASRAVGAPLGLQAFWNFLEPASDALDPRARDFREALETEDEASILAGSGSARALVFPDPQTAARARDRIEAAGVARLVSVGRTGVPGVERIDA